MLAVSRLNVCLLLLLFAALTMIPVMAAKATQRRAKENEPCTACHRQLEHGGTGGLFTEECAFCHTAGSMHDQKGRQPSVPSKRAQSETPAGAKQAITAGKQGEQHAFPPRPGSEPNSMVLVPAGAFVRGTDNRLPDEGPQHSLTIDAFYIDRYEVTNRQYEKFNTATNRASPSHFRNRTYPDGKADHPVTFVSWDDANAYCEWAGKRLPTDSEWEKAARGPDGRIFPWGDSFDPGYANTPGHWQDLGQEGDTTPVGAFPAGVSPYGAYDMAGNVWEWTSSWYQPYPGNTHLTENYGEHYKVLKGGSWWDCSFYHCGISAPSYNRAFFLPSTRNKSFGFRCARDAH